MTPTTLIVVLIILVVILAVWLFRVLGRPAPAPKGDVGASTILIGPERAVSGALEGFKKYGLDRREDWQPYLAAPVAAQTPVPVQRLDLVDPAEAYYYLVPFGTSADAVRAVALVDGLTGEYLEATPMPSGQRLATDHGRQPGVGGEHPFWVWRPCVESRSPYYPFKLAATNGKVQYRRIDGPVFDRLTDLGPGGLEEYDHDPPASE